MADRDRADLREDSDKQKVLAYCEKLKEDLAKQSYAGEALRVKLDVRDIAGADKKWEWIKKGAPLLLEIGPRDVEGGKVCLMRRDQLAQGKRFLTREEFLAAAAAELTGVQKTLFDDAVAFRAKRTVTDIKDRKAFEAYFAADNGFAGNAGFVRAKWSGDPGVAHAAR